LGIYLKDTTKKSQEQTSWKHSIRSSKAKFAKQEAHLAKLATKEIGDDLNHLTPKFKPHM
jgi:putative component of toxin-antitoxin plasmid stabilization module